MPPRKTTKKPAPKPAPAPRPPSKVTKDGRLPPSPPRPNDDPADMAADLEKFSGPVPTPEPEPTTETVATPAEPEKDTTDSPGMAEDFDEFVTPKEVAAMKTVDTAIPLPSGDVRTYVGEAVAAMGQKLHETEYAITRHPVFIHTQGDERLWGAFGNAVAKELPPAVKGLVLTGMMVAASEGFKFAIYANDRRKAQAPNEPKGAKKK